MKKAISNILFILYAAIAIFVTVCLLSFNQFKVTEFGSKSLVLITDDGLMPDYKKGDLVIVDKSKQIITGRKAFFYTTSNQKLEVKLGVVESFEKVTRNRNNLYI